MMFFETASLDGQIRCDNAEAKKWVVEGEMAFDRKDFDKAASCFTEALHFDPRNHEILFYRGLAYGHAGANDRAVADFTETIRLKPGQSHLADAYDARGAVYGSLGDFGKAVADLTEAIRLQPTFAPPTSTVGRYTKTRATSTMQSTT